LKIFRRFLQLAQLTNVKRKAERRREARLRKSTEEKQNVGKALHDVAIKNKIDLLQVCYVLHEV